MIYAVGDIHGQLTKLDGLLKLLDDAGLNHEHRLVFLGDYVDRGPDTAGVLRRLIDLRSTRPNTTFLRGNHEQMMLDARQKFDPSFDCDNPAGNCESGVFWFAEGGTETLQSYGARAGRHWSNLVPDEHWQFLHSTQLEYEEGAYRFVHAGVLPPGKRWNMDGFAADPRLWIRDVFHVSESDFGGKVIVFGHTPTSDGMPLMRWNKIGIDTGAGFGGPLTAVGLPEIYDRRKVQVLQT